MRGVTDIRAFVADTLPPTRRAATREQDRGGAKQHQAGGLLLGWLSQGQSRVVGHGLSAP